MSDSDIMDDWDWIDNLDPIQNHWSQEERKFVRTNACRIVAQKMQTHDRILITGKSGTGKSAIARHAAQSYAMDGKRVTYVTAHDEIEHIPTKIGTLTDIFVIDDPIGKASLDLLACRWWETQKEQLDYFLRRSIKGRKLAPYIRVLVTCRENLIDDETTQFFENYAIVNIDADTLVLTTEEKRNILENHMDISSVSDKDNKIILETTSAFPTLCHTVGINTNFQRNVGQFFQSPYKSIRNEVIQFKETSREKYMGLFLLVIGDGELNEASYLSDCSLQSEEDVGGEDENLSRIQNGSIINMLKVFGLPQTTTAQTIIEGLHALIGEFLINIEETYRFQNSILFEACLHYFCTEEPKLFLEYCNGFFFRNYATTQNQQEWDEDLFPRLCLQDKLIPDYAKRIADDICDGTFLDVFLCPWTSDKRIIMAVEKILRTKNPKELLALALEAELAKEDLGLFPLVKKQRLKSEGFSKLDLISYGDNISPIVLSLIFNHNEIFSAMFEMLKQHQICCAHLRKQSLLAAVCANGSVKLANLILKFFGNDERNSMWNMNEKIHAIHIAANFHHIGILSLLLCQENVNVTTSLEETPLYLALLVQRQRITNPSSRTEKTQEEERLETVSLLIQNGASVNVYPKHNSSLVTLACKTNNSKAVQLLLENGAKVNEADTSARNGLHFASMHGNTDLMKILLSNGAEMNQCLARKESALYYAAKNGNSQVVDMLLSKGAEKELEDFRWNSPFYVACRNGNVNLVKRFLDYSKEHLENLNSDTVPILHAAIKSGNDEIVQLLFKNGVKIETRTKYSVEFPLCLAASLGHVAIIKLLLERKAEVDIVTKTGCTPLIIASRFGHFLAAQCLLENKADINKCDNDGKSPLYYASRYGHLDVVQLLLKHNADTRLRADTGDDALFMASLWGHYDVTKELLKHKNVEIHDEHTINSEKKQDKEKNDRQREEEEEASPRTALSGAVRHGHRKIVELLIADGADVNETIDNDSTPLNIAAQGGFVDILTILLEKGANVNLSDSENDNPLHTASVNGNIGVMDTLLKSGTNINETQTDGYTPLHLALLGGNRKTALYLLDHGSDVNTIASGQSPLLLACGANFTDVVSKLLSKGAQVNPERNGQPLDPSPLGIAVMKGAPTLARLLLRHGAMVNLKSSTGKSPLFYAIQSDHCVVAKLLIDNNARVNDQDKSGNTCLHESIRLHKHDEILSLLLGNTSTNVNVRNQDGTAPLLLALSGKQGASEGRIRLLIDHGADVNSRDKVGTTALHRAAHEGYATIVELLLNHGADVDQTNDEGESALLIATKNGHEAVVKALLHSNANTRVLTKSGENPLDVAKREGFENIVKLVTEKSETNGEDVDTEPSSKKEERKLVMVRNSPLGPTLPRKRSPYKIPVRR